MIRNKLDKDTQCLICIPIGKKYRKTAGNLHLGAHAGSRAIGWPNLLTQAAVQARVDSKPVSLLHSTLLTIAS